MLSLSTSIFSLPTDDKSQSHVFVATSMASGGSFFELRGARATGKSSCLTSTRPCVIIARMGKCFWLRNSSQARGQPKAISYPSHVSPGRGLVMRQNISIDFEKLRSNYPHRTSKEGQFGGKLGHKDLREFMSHTPGTPCCVQVSHSVNMAGHYNPQRY